MSIEFRCPQCARLLQAGDGTAGRRVLCPGCGAFSTVPGAATDAPKAPPAPQSGGEPSKASAPPPSAASGSPFGRRRLEPDDEENPYRAPTQYGPAPTPVPYDGPVPRTDSRAAVSLALGLGGLIFSCICFPPLAIPLGAIGLMLGIMARRSSSRGMAIAGIVLCAIQLALGLASIVFMAMWFWWAWSSPPGW